MTFYSRNARWHLTRVALCSAVLLAAAGCSHVKESGSWDGPRPAGAPYQHVLVIGVSPESRMRRSFEEQMTAALKAGGTKATASIFVGSEMNTEALTQDIVVAMIRKTRADAVLVTRMVSDKVKEGRTKEQAILKAEPTVTIDQTSDFTVVMASDFDLTQVPGQVEALEDAMIEATVYDVAEKGRPVFRANIEDKFTAEDAGVIPDVAADLASAIEKELRDNGVVR